MFKSPSSKPFSRSNGRRRSQIQDNDTTITTRDMPSTVDPAKHKSNSLSQRLMRTRTSASKTKGEPSSAVNSAPNSRPVTRGKGASSESLGDSDVCVSDQNDSPLSIAGSAQFYYDESPTRSATILPSNSLRSKDPSSASVSSSNRCSAVLDSSEVDVAAAIALLQELKKRASPEDLIALHKALLPTRNVITTALAQSEVNDVDEPLSPMIRRSSLLPAGVKTRLSRELLRNFSDQSAPLRSTSQGPRQSPDLEKPLNFEALDLANEALEAKAARAATPSDFACPQVGTYKLGSLRITNGSASPEPRLLLNMAEKAGDRDSVGDGFVTADEEDSNPLSVRKPRAGSSGIYEFRESSTYRPKATPSDSGARSRNQPPLRADTLCENFGEQADRRTSPQPSRPRQQQRASDTIVPDYAAEFEMSNPHFSVPPLTARLSPVRDESPTNGSSRAREDALRQLTGEAVDPDARQSTGQRYLGVTRPPMHAKSDSGYSSEASRRPNSIVKESHVDEFLSAALDAADQAERTRSRQQTPESSQISLDKQGSEDVYTTQIVDARGLPAPQKAERRKSMPSFFSSSRKTASSTSVNTLDSTPAALTSKQSKKLQKSKRQSRHERNVTPHQAETPKDAKVEPVPAVPEDASVNFSRRMVRAHTSQVDGAPGPTDQSPRTPVEDDGDRRGRDRSRKRDKKADRSPEESTRRSFFRFRSRSRSKSQHRREEPAVLSVEDEPLPTFSDFSTVAQSIGSSPYDVATRRGKEAGQYDDSKPTFHPHGMSGSYQQHAAQDDSISDGGRDRSRSHSRPRRRGAMDNEPVERFSGAATSFSKSPSHSRSRRSTSAHAVPSSQTPQKIGGDAQAEPLPSPRDDGVRVGTIDFGNGVGQGRLAPILTPSEKAKARRRTQSVAARPRYFATDAAIPEEPMPSQSSARKTSKAPVEAEKAKSQTVQAPKSPVVVKKSPKAPVQAKVPGPKTLDTQSPRVPASPTYTAVPKLPETPPRVEASRPLASHPSSSAQTPTRASMPNWESQTRSWRQRRQSIGEALYPTSDNKRPVIAPKVPSWPAVEHVYVPTTPRRTPQVVVSRYITPHGSEFCTPTLEDNDPYRSLHSDNPTDHLPAQEDIDRTDSSSTYRTAGSGKSQDSFASNDSAKYRPYRPPPGHDATVGRLMGSAVQTRASVASFEPRRRSTAPPEEHIVPYDRFSGGLSYGWERGAGFGGSAGTRQKSDNKASRKSVVLSESFGVDLSDVPMFFVRP